LFLSKERNISRSSAICSASSFTAGFLLLILSTKNKKSLFSTHFLHSLYL
jgi:hypothetical protein